jgi:hypothetical protein
MAGDKVDRKTGQAEMDGYLQNPNDWACAYTTRILIYLFHKTCAIHEYPHHSHLCISDNRLNGYSVDYLSLDNKKIVLTLTWAAFILTLLGRGGYCVVTGDYYWDILH